MLGRFEFCTPRRRWRPFVGLADALGSKRSRMIFANPFPFNASVYPKVKAATANGYATCRETRHRSHFTSRSSWVADVLRDNGMRSLGA